VSTTFDTTEASLNLHSGYSLGLVPGTTHWVTDIQGWYKAAPNRREKAEKAGRHGSYGVRGWKDERLVTVAGHYHAPDRATAAAFVDEINACMADGEEGILRVNDLEIGSRWANVYLLAPDVTWKGGRDVPFFLDMVAPDPRKFGGLMVEGPTGAFAGGDGLKFDLFATDTPGILDFGAEGESGKVTVSNPGTAPTEPVFRVQGPPDFATGVGSFKITEAETERVLEWQGTLLTGQELVLDSRSGTVVLGTNGDRKGGLVRSQWPEIPGNSSRSYTFEAVGGLTLVVEAHPAWW